MLLHTTALLLLVVRATTVSPPPLPVPADAVFKPGEGPDGGWACFRAPSLHYTADGTRLLAIVEAYKYHCVSRQWCDIVQKVSLDNGVTWSEVSLVHGTGAKGGNASSPCCNNVAPTLDRTTGELFLPLHAAFNAPGASPKEPPRVVRDATLMVSSTDGGRSYSAARDVSAEFAQGVPSMPGGTQLSASGGGATAGRLIVPTYRMNECPSGAAVAPSGRRYCSYLVVSDTHGRTWRAAAEAANGSECMAVVLANGSVLLNMRDSSPGIAAAAAAAAAAASSASSSSVGRALGAPLGAAELRSSTTGSGRRERRLALSTDGGDSFAHEWLASDLPDPVVEGATVRVPGSAQILFSHPSPADPQRVQDRIRENLTVWSSDFDSTVGAIGSWKALAVVAPGPSAYSAMAVLPNRSEVLVLFEAGDVTPDGDPCQGKHPCWQVMRRVKL